MSSNSPMKITVTVAVTNDEFGANPAPELVNLFNKVLSRVRAKGLVDRDLPEELRQEYKIHLRSSTTL